MQWRYCSKNKLSVSKHTPFFFSQSKKILKEINKYETSHPNQFWVKMFVDLLLSGLILKEIIGSVLVELWLKCWTAT